MTEQWALDVLMRPEVVPDWNPEWYRGKRVVVTGSEGSLGPTVCEWLSDAGATVTGMDLPDGDILAGNYVSPVDVVIHLAGAKSAPDGESDVETAATVNAIGTLRVLDAYGYPESVAIQGGSLPGALLLTYESLESPGPLSSRVVVVSTCKAADPETAYGASKLLAEKAALEARQRVVRLVNVVDTNGNVFDTWRNLPDGEPIQVAGECVRMFMTKREACSLILRAAWLDPGRYALAARRALAMYDVSFGWTMRHKRTAVHMDERRGDRLVERLLASCEHEEQTEDPKIIRIVSPHDPRTR